MPSMPSIVLDPSFFVKERSSFAWCRDTSKVRRARSKRKSVHNLILGFEKLRSHIPAYAASSSEVRLTKKDILSAAMSYIRDLEALLREPSERWKDCEPTSSMTTTEQTNEVVSAVGQRASSTTSSSEQNDEILQLPRELPHSLTGSPNLPPLQASACQRWSSGMERIRHTAGFQSCRAWHRKQGKVRLQWLVLRLNQTTRSLPNV